MRAGFQQQPFMRLLRAAVDCRAPGVVAVAIRHRNELEQQHGFFHGGVTATLADNAAGFAAFSLMGDDSQPLSVEFKINFLAPAQGARLVGVGSVLRNGRTLKICRAEVTAVSDEESVHCATALATVIALTSPQ